MANTCRINNYKRNVNDGSILFHDLTFDGNVQNLALQIIDQIKKLPQRDFAVSYDETADMETYMDSIHNLVNDAVGAIPSDIKNELTDENITEIKRAIESQFMPSRTEVIERAVADAVLNGDDSITEAERQRGSLDSFVQNVYGRGSTDMDNERRVRFAQNVSKNCIINVEERLIIDNDETLNQSIVSMQNASFKIIWNYMNSKHPDFIKKYCPSSALYVYEDHGRFQSVRMNPGYTAVMLAMYNEVEKLRRKGELQGEIDTGWADYINNRSNDFYDALSAYIDLNYFDENIKECVENLLNIDNKLDVPIVYNETERENKYRYKLNTKSKDEFWNWRDDILDATKVIGGYTKTLIRSIPLIDYHSKTIIRNSISPNQFQLAFAKLKNARFSGIEDAILSLYTETGRSDGALKTIYQKLFVEPFYSTERYGLTEDDFNVLYSFFTTVMFGKNSWSSIEQEYAEENGIQSSRLNTVDTLFNVIRSTTMNNYIETVYNKGYDDKKGGYVTRFKPSYLSDRNVYRVSRGINNYTVTRTDKIPDSVAHFYGPFDIREFYIKVGDTPLHVSIEPGHEILGRYHSMETYFKIEEDLNPGSIKAAIKQNGKIIEDVEEYILNNLNTAAGREAFLDNLQKSDETGNKLKDILTFIDKMLNLGFLTPDGLRLLYLTQAKKGSGKHELYNQTLLKMGIKKVVGYNYTPGFLHDVLVSSMQAYTVYTIYQHMKSLTDDDGVRLFADNEMRRYLLEHGDSMYKGNWRNINYKGEGAAYKFLFYKNRVGEFMQSTHNNPWIQDYVAIKAVLDGDTANAVIRNLENDNVPNMSTAYLGSEATAHMYKIEHKDDKGVAINGRKKNPIDHLMRFRNAIENMGVNSDIRTKRGIVKQVKSMDFSELLYDSLINKFVIPLASNNRKDHAIFVQPATYSDKSTYIQAQIDPSIIQVKNKYSQDVQLSSLITASNERREEFILRNTQRTIGNYYKDVLDQVVSDLEKVLKVKGIDNVIKELRGLTEQELIRKAAKYNSTHNENIILYKDLHYRGSDGLELNELLKYYGTKLYQNTDYLKKILAGQKVQFLRQYIENNIDLSTDEQFIEGFKSLFDHELDSEWVQKTYDQDYEAADGAIYHGNEIKKIYIGKIKNTVTGEVRPILNEDFTLSENEELILNPLLDSYFMIETYLSENLRIKLLGSEINHKIGKVNLLEAIRNGLGFKTDAETLSYLKTLNPDINDKVSYEEVQAIVDNPTLNDSTVKKIRDIYDGIMLKRMADAQTAQLKRNVTATAPMTKFTPNMAGIISEMKVAYVYDTQADVFNIRGDRKADLDSCDGSALVNPVWSRLENNSLLDKAVGDVKKPLGYDYNMMYGTTTLLKYATYAITNYWMRQSEGNENGVRLFNVFKKMTNLPWHDGAGKPLYGDFNLVGDTNGKGFAEVIDRGNLFYRVGKSHYRIDNFDYDFNNKVYYTEELHVWADGKSTEGIVKVYHYFDEDGNHVKSRTPLNDPKLHTIDSVFELYQAFGGMYSESLGEDGYLHYDESSVDAVTGYANNVLLDRNPKTDEEEDEDENEDYDAPEPELTLKNYRQPLKEAMIASVVNNTAVKMGAGNINPASSWKDNTPLNFCTIRTDQYGLQQDSDHPADEAEMTLFTQVISALDLGGYAHELVTEIYQALGKLALESTKVELDAMNEYLQSQGKNKNSLYDVVGRTIITNFADSRNSQFGLSSAILNNVKEAFQLHENHAEDKFKLPFSDNTIYQGFMATLISQINKKGIKLKFPGLATVMVPSYNMSMIYENAQGQKLQYQDILNLALNSRIARTMGTATEDPTAFNHELVKKYLQNEQTKMPRIGIEQIYPTDNVWVEISTTDGGETHVQIGLENIDDYYSFKDNPKKFIKNYIRAHEEYKGVKLNEILYYQKGITRPRNLAPTKLAWTYTDDYGNVAGTMNIYDHPTVKNLFKQISDINHSIDTPEGKKQRIKEARRAANVDGLLLNLKSGRVKIGNKWYTVPANAIENRPPELIMSNIYKSAFGIEDGDSLYDVMSQGADYFKKKTRPFIRSDNFQLAIITSKSPVYVTFSDAITNTNESAVNRRWGNVRKIRHTAADGTVYNEVQALTSDNQPMFTVGYESQVDVQKTGIHYLDRIGKFVDRYDNIMYDQYKYSINSMGDIYEYHEIVHRKKITEKNSYKPTTIDHIDGLDISLNELRNLAKIKDKNLSDDEIQIEANRMLKGIMSDVYAAEGGEMVQISNKLNSFLIKNNVITTALNAIAGSQPDTAFQNFISSLKAELKNYKPSEDDESVLTIKNRALYVQQMAYYNRLASLIYASFIESQNFVAARIPSQNMSSFMAMENVGWTGQSNGICYVSRWQTWLQGSDYDIDKAYIMGLSFNGHGMFQGWSGLFKYDSPALLRASEGLPFPSGINYQLVGESVTETELLNRRQAVDKAEMKVVNAAAALKTDGSDKNKKAFAKAVENYRNVRDILLDSALDVSNFDRELKEIQGQIDEAYKAGIDSEQLKLRLINKQIEILKKLNKYNGYIQGRIGGVEENSNIMDMLWKHEHTRVSPQQRQDGLRNYVSKGIQFVVQDLSNISRAMIPGDVADLQDAVRYSSIARKQESLNLLNPNVKFLMQYQSTVGKQGVGVFANATKALFNYMYYANDIIMNHKDKLDMLRFSVQTKGILGRHTGKAKSVEVNQMTGLNTDSLTDKQKAQLGNVLDPNITSDNSMSQLVTGATDNAKLRILGLINGSPKLGDMYAFMVGLGFNFDDIVAFMTSPVAVLIDTLSKTNVFTGTEMNVPDAIKVAAGLADGFKKSGKYSEADIEKMKAVRQEILGQPDEFGHVLTEAEIASDVYDFINMYNGGQELNSLAAFLKLNQGVPTTKADLLKYENQLAHTVANKVNISADSTVPENMDIVGWLNDPEYRIKAISEYQTNRTAINFLDVFESLEHFKSFREILKFAHYASGAMSVKSRIMDEASDFIRKNYDKTSNPTDRYNNSLLRQISNSIILRYIQGNKKLKFPVRKGQAILTGDAHRTVYAENENMDLSSYTDIANFKYIFENTIIPTLKDGKIPVIENGVYKLKEVKGLSDNPFIMALKQDKSNDVTVYGVALNMRVLGNSTYAQARFQVISRGLAKLAGEEYKINDIKLSDWFALYNIITTGNSASYDSMTPLFDKVFLQDTENLMYDYLRYVGEVDAQGNIYDINHVPDNVGDYDLVIDFENLLRNAALTVFSSKGQHDPYIRINEPDKGYVVYERKGKAY